MPSVKQGWGARQQEVPLVLEPVAAVRPALRGERGQDRLRHGIAALREDIADLEARLDASRESAEALPHRRKYLLLANDLLHGLLALHLDWVERVEAELDPHGEPPA
jgi:hypothetical protein